MKINLLFLLLIVFLCEACTKVNTDPTYPVQPAIQLVSVSQDTLTAFTDRLLVVISYTDGDGDLGTSNPDQNLISVQDSRLTNADGYYLPPLAPETAQLSITGTFHVELSPTFLLGNGNAEKLTYTITVSDRAGHQSNVVTTPEITVISE